MATLVETSLPEKRRILKNPTPIVSGSYVPDYKLCPGWLCHLEFIVYGIKDPRTECEIESKYLPILAEAIRLRVVGSAC